MIYISLESGYDLHQSGVWVCVPLPVIDPVSCVGRRRVHLVGRTGLLRFSCCHTGRPRFS